MESVYVPIYVKSGVSKGLTEGTEVVVKREYFEESERKTPLYYIYASVMFFGVILWGLALFTLFAPKLAEWYPLLRLNPFLLITLLFIPEWSLWLIFLLLIEFDAFLGIMVVLGKLLKRYFKIIVKEKREMQETVFFPNIIISKLEDIIGIYDRIPETAEGRTLIGFYGHLPYPIWKEFKELVESSEWKNVELFDENTGEVWVKGEDWGIIGAFRCPELCNKVKQVVHDFYNQAKSKIFRQIEYLEMTGRYEEAARIYEKLDMPEKAGEIRRKKREIVVVDLNALIRQLGERGFTITYNCAHCGAPVRISGETKAEAIQHCSHCGSRIETIDVANFIKKYLS